MVSNAELRGQNSETGESKPSRIDELKENLDKWDVSLLFGIVLGFIWLYIAGGISKILDIFAGVLMFLGANKLIKPIVKKANERGMRWE